VDISHKHRIPVYLKKKLFTPQSIFTLNAYKLNHFGLQNSWYYELKMPDVMDPSFAVSYYFVNACRLLHLLLFQSSLPTQKHIESLANTTFKIMYHHKYVSTHICKFSYNMHKLHSSANTETQLSRWLVTFRFCQPNHHLAIIFIHILYAPIHLLLNITCHEIQFQFQSINGTILCSMHSASKFKSSSAQSRELAVDLIHQHTIYRACANKDLYPSICNLELTTVHDLES
jgi:hypothetical protein